jgi:hypothetical protein
VDYIHIGILLGYVESVLAGGLLSLNLDREVESKALLAFNKLLWIQNDYFAKYYCNPAAIHDVKVIAKKESVFASLTSPASLLPLAVGVIAGALGVYYQLRRN